ncbi:hypothetical protein [Arthrobacter sp. Leaf141]|uniref:hypothetical protein n=1 Tax=Arthrobacter sp. Leaf141 TaxID=1736273 RepID=UPI003FA4A627
MSRPPAPPPEPAVPAEEPDSRPDSAVGDITLHRPRAVLVVAGIVAAEATALLVAAAWYGYQLFSGSPVLSFWGAVFTLGLMLAFSAWLYATAVFLSRGYRWTRAAALVAQLFVLVIGFPSISGGVVIPGLLMVIPAIIATLLLFSSKVIGFATRTGNPAPTL